MIKDFKKFLLQTNVVNLAVAVVIGAAVTALVQSVVLNLITPLLGIPGKIDFSALSLHVGKAVFHYGLVINAAIAFLVTALVVFLLFIKPIERAQAFANGRKAPGPVTTKTCPACLSTIPIAATRCSSCPQRLPAISSLPR